MDLLQINATISVLLCGIYLYHSYTLKKKNRSLLRKIDAFKETERSDIIKIVHLKVALADARTIINKIRDESLLINSEKTKELFEKINKYPVNVFEDIKINPSFEETYKDKIKEIQDLE